MIRVRFSPERTRLLAIASSVVEAPRVLPYCLELAPDELLVPTLDHLSLVEWLGRVSAFYGPGTHDILRNMRVSMLQQQYDLTTHPARWGHGLLGFHNEAPLGVWKVEGAVYPMELYDYRPNGGPEGFLVPTFAKAARGATMTHWTFVELEHGDVRPASTWFPPEFGYRNPREDARDGAAAKARAAKELRARVEQGLEADGDEEGD